MTGLYQIRRQQEDDIWRGRPTLHDLLRSYKHVNLNEYALSIVCGTRYDDRPTRRNFNKMTKYLVMMFLSMMAIASASTLGEEDAPPVCVCNRILMPVCGTDGITYSNDCVLECAARQGTSRGIELRIAHDGMCAPNEGAN